jgi:hypothetical protein
MMDTIQVKLRLFKALITVMRFNRLYLQKKLTIQFGVAQVTSGLNYDAPSESIIGSQLIIYLE